jgi:hypothetical protein
MAALAVGVARAGASVFLLRWSFLAYSLGEIEIPMDAYLILRLYFLG